MYIKQIQLFSTYSFRLFHRHAWLLCIALGFTGSGPSAQGNDPHVDIQLIGPDQGLPNRNTRCIAQDSLGFLWLAAGAGLWRYDGYNYENYTHLLTLTSGPITFINDIQKGPDNKIWVAHNNGISVIDPISFSCMSRDPTKFFPGRLASKLAIKIHFDKTGNTWVALSGNTLVKLDQTLKPLLIYTPSETDAGAAFKTSFFSTVIEDEGVKLYLFSKNNYIDVIDTAGKYKNRINLMTDSLGRAGYVTSSILPYTKAEFLVYYTRGDFKNSLVRRYSLAKQSLGPPEKNLLLSNPEASYVGSNGMIWYKSNVGVGMLNPGSGKFVNLSEQLQQKSGIQNYFFNAYVGSDNSFWLCSNAGLFKINITEHFFKKYLDVPLKKASDVGTSMRGISEDNTGTLWLCSYGYKHNGNTYALLKLDPRTGRIEQPKLTPRNTSGNYILYKCIFLNHNIYTITDGELLLKINRESLRFTVIDFPGITGNEFTSIFALSDSTLLMGTLSGMAMMNTKKEQPVLLNDQKGNYIQNVRVNYFMPWSANHLLVSTFNGLYVLDNEARIVEHYGNSAGDKISLPTLRIFHTTWYQNMLWASSAEGLIRIDTTRKKAEIFTTREGLPDNNIYAALADDRGNLWLSTNYGLCRFNATTNRVYNYGLADGLPHMEFNNASFLKASDGKLYFGGLNGIIGFDPARIDTAEAPAARLRLISYSKYLGDSNRVETVSGNNPETAIVFNPGDRLLTFSFMTPDYRNIGQTRFRYKLEGWDKDQWHPFETGNKLFFNSLAPGNYTLHVQVSVGGTNWRAQEWQTHINVKTPWFRTVWFYMLSLLAVSGILYLFYRNRLAHLLRIQQIRSRISADMHDEIGSTLSSITFYSQALLMQTEEGAQKAVLQKIKDNAQQVQEGLSDIIWSIKTNIDELENVSARMFSFGSELLDSKGILLHFSEDEKLKPVRLDMTRRKNLYLIFKEAVNNAAKYSQCKSIWVNLETNGRQVRMVIRDDGLGFNSLITKQGNGLFNMRERAAQMKGRLLIESVENEGTTITLMF